MAVVSPQGTVLLVDDSASVRALITTLLGRAGYRVVSAEDGEQALELFEGGRPDVVLLDVNLPGISGWEVLERLRERSRVPIAMVSGMGDDASKVRGLNNGADDYLVKTASPVELVARVGALLRRGRTAAPADEPPVYDDGLVRIDFGARSVTLGRVEVRLTPLEYRLLVAFVRHRNQVLSRDDLLREVWHDFSGGPNDHVKTYVGYLRRKLADAVPGGDAPLETVRGFGYRWRPAA